MANNLMNFDPFGSLAHFEPFRRFDEFFKGMPAGLRDMEVEPRIKMDVTETDRAYTVKAEIPGVKKEDIKIDIDGNQVSITAETRRESEEKEGESVVRSERYYGQQYRSFTLAHEIDDTEAAAAKYQDGVLELTLPKKQRSSSKKVVVS